MGKELKNSSGEVRQIISEPSGERGLGEVAMTCSDGEYKEGPNDENYIFGAVDFSQGRAKIGTMSVAVNERGIVRFEGMSDHGTLDLTIDLNEPDSEGNGEVLGHINGKIVKEKIDPDAPEQGDRDLLSRIIGNVGTSGPDGGTWFGGPFGEPFGILADQFAGRITDNITGSHFRDIPNKVKFEANKSFLDTVQPLGLNPFTMGLTIAQKWINARVQAGSDVQKILNAALAACSQKLLR